MMKPILLVSLAALAVPAFAQNVSGPVDPVRSQAQGPAPMDDDDDDDGLVMGHSAMSHGHGAESAGADAQAWSNTTAPGKTTDGYEFTGVGGPIDIPSQWAAISPRGADLTPLEFGIWMLEQNGENVDRRVESTRRSRAADLPAIQVLNVTAGALAQADTNGDWRVSQSELQAFVGL